MMFHASDFRTEAIPCTLQKNIPGRLPYSMWATRQWPRIKESVVRNQYKPMNHPRAKSIARSNDPPAEVQRNRRLFCPFLKVMPEKQLSVKNTFFSPIYVLECP